MSIPTSHMDDSTVFQCLQMLTVAPVLQIGPDDVFLREAEHAQAPASHTDVNDHTSVRHQI